MRKGVIAGIAGIALLAGGGASFATWSADWTTSGRISSGTMSLKSSWQGEPISHWQLNDADIVGITKVADLKLVPGDKLTYRDNITLSAEKRAMSVNLEPLAPGIVGNLQGVTYSVKVTGPDFERTWNGRESKPMSIETRAGSDTAMSVVTTFTFDTDADNSTKNKNLTFTDAGIRVTQVANAN
ncbi:alternate-type signal peptide domain-containing protein [Georgenia ruanii]|uniref:Alternate-type signal peptide domain-containing protein n=2 Tax=Georgenia ruanii TaxID=348442 RepID=A0A7J9UZW2_9MICO|nr:alternate-type signal peptide domain-containing protein [Georgenia ruanii]